MYKINRRLLLYSFCTSHAMWCTTTDSWPSGIGQASPPIHPLASSQGAVFLINSCQRYFRCGRPNRSWDGKPYSKVTAAFLPSSLKTSHSFALVYSTWSPVSVCGTVSVLLCLEAFLGSSLYLIYLPEGRHFCLARICVTRIYPRYILTQQTQIQ